MSRKNAIPGYRLHKQSGQAYVSILGKQKLLGPYNSPESKSRYARALALLNAANAESPAMPPPGSDPATLSMSALLLDLYWGAHMPKPSRATPVWALPDAKSAARRRDGRALFSVRLCPVA